MPDEGWLRCLRVRDEMWLCHSGTGELRQVPNELSRAELVFDPNTHEGALFVRACGAGSEAQCVWARDLMHEGLHCVDDHTWLIKRGEEMTRFEAAVECNGRSRTFGCKLASGFEFVCEVFVNCIASGPSLWWALPYIVVKALGKLPSENYLGKQFESWRRAVEDFGLDTAELKPSIKRRVSKPMRRSEEVNSSVLDEAYDDFTASTAVVVGILVRIALSGNRHERANDSQDGICARVVRLLVCLAERFCKHMCFDIEVRGGSEELGLLSIRAGVAGECVVHFQAAGARASDIDNSFFGRRRLSKSFLALGHALSAKASLLRRTKKAAVVHNAFLQLCGMLEDAATASRDQPWWSDYSALDLDIRQGVSGRACRLPKSFKQVVADEVSQNTHLRTAQSLLSARNVLHKKGGRHSAKKGSLSAKPGTAFCVENMYQYWQAGRRLLCGQTHFNVGIDGTTVSGQEVNMIANYSVDKGVALWLPPQDPRCNGGALSGDPGGGARVVVGWPRAHLRGVNWPQMGSGKAENRICRVVCFWRRPVRPGS